MRPRSSVHIPTPVYVQALIMKGSRQGVKDFHYMHHATQARYDTVVYLTEMLRQRSNTFVSVRRRSFTTGNREEVEWSPPSRFECRYPVLDRLQLALQQEGHLRRFRSLSSSSYDLTPDHLGFPRLSQANRAWGLCYGEAFPTLQLALQGAHFRWRWLVEGLEYLM